MKPELTHWVNRDEELPWFSGMVLVRIKYINPETKTEEEDMHVMSYWFPDEYGDMDAFILEEQLAKHDYGYEEYKITHWMKIPEITEQ